MDSTLLGSNLAACTRLQLIIGCLQEFWKSLTDEQKAGLSEADRALLDRLCAKRPSQHIYRLEETAKQAWLDELGPVLLRLHQTDDLKSSPRYALIERLLLEQYQIEDADEQTRVVLKPTQEIGADSLQSPHDEDAAYRKKRDETVRGYSESNEAYAQVQGKDIYYTGFPGKPGRYDYERISDGVVVIDRDSGERQLAEEYKPGRYRFRADNKWRYVTDKAIEAAACRRRTEALPRELFNRRCNVEVRVLQRARDLGLPPGWNKRSGSTIQPHTIS